MSSTEQLEREAEATRRSVNETLDELRMRMTPGRMLDEVVDYVQDGSTGDFYRNLRDQAVGNPLPVVLIGAGLSWLAASHFMPARKTSSGMASGRSSTISKVRPGPSFGDRAHAASSTVSSSVSDGMSGMRQSAHDAGDSIAGAGRRMADGMSDAGDSTMDAAARARDSVRDTMNETWAAGSDHAAAAADAVSATAAHAYEAAADTTQRAGAAFSQSAQAMSNAAAGASRRFKDLYTDQPLVLIGAGILLGAALAAVAPATEVENQLMGEARDDLANQVSDVAAEQYEKVSSAAQHAYEEGKAELQKDMFGKSGGDSQDGNQEGNREGHQQGKSDETRSDHKDQNHAQTAELQTGSDTAPLVPSTQHDGEARHMDRQNTDRT